MGMGGNKINRINFQPLAACMDSFFLKVGQQGFYLQSKLNSMHNACLF